jgi:hypothetical protein
MIGKGRRLMAAAAVVVGVGVTALDASPAAADECTAIFCGKVYNQSSEAVFITRWGASGPTGSTMVLLPGTNSLSRMKDVDAFSLQCPGTVQIGGVPRTYPAGEHNKWHRISSLTTVYVTYQTNCV